MDSPVSAEATANAAPQAVAIRIFGIGTAGTNVLGHIIAGGIPASACVALNTDPQALAASSAGEKIPLDTRLLRGLGTGGDPDRGKTMAEEQAGRLKQLCDGHAVIFVVAGLGGGAGTGVSPVIARIAKETGALVLGFVMIPFECEGNRRLFVAEQGLEAFAEAADGLICLPNQKLFKFMDENASVLEAFRLSNELMADAVRGMWRLIAHKGLIEIHVEEICNFIRDRHAESAFAMAEAMGPTRSRDVVEKLMAHPLLEGGELPSQAEAVLVSIVGGPDLTMAEVNRIMEQVSTNCSRSQVIMGATIDESFRERLAVTLIAVGKAAERASRTMTPGSRAEGIENQLLSRSESPRAGSRFVPPPPTLPPDQVQQLLARQKGSGSRVRKSHPKLRQTQLPLEIISKGRFDKSEPTIHKGEDLDVPTYIRRGVSLN
jgi:cell division protein FtsZ